MEAKHLTMFRYFNAKDVRELISIMKSLGFKYQGLHKRDMAKLLAQYTNHLKERENGTV